MTVCLFFEMESERVQKILNYLVTCQDFLDLKTWNHILINSYKNLFQYQFCIENWQLS